MPRCDTDATTRTMVCKFSANFPACASRPPTGGAALLRQGVLRRGWHRIPWWVVGTPGTPLWVVLHGGPGSGASPALLAPFDLQRCQVLLFDQRGCGGARPGGGRAQAGWRHLVADMEALRTALGAERWSVLGGSWGATLALAYARAHADRIERLVQRCAFLWTAADMARVFAPQGFAQQARTLGEAAPWRVRIQPAPVLHGLRRVFHFGDAVTPGPALWRWQWLEQRALLRGMRRSVLHGGGARGAPAMVALQRTARRTRARLGDRLPGSPGAALRDKARVQFGVLGLRRGWSAQVVSDALAALARHRVRVDWLHGRFDAVCDPARAFAAHRRLPAGLSRWRAVDAGHLAVEPAMAAALRELVRQSGEGA